WDLVTRENYCYGYLSLLGLDHARPIVNQFWDYVDEHDGDMNPHRMAFTQFVCCADTDAEAEKQYEKAIQYFYKTQAIRPHFMAPPGYITPASMRASLKREDMTDRSVHAQTGTGILDRGMRGELS